MKRTLLFLLCLSPLLFLLYRLFAGGAEDPVKTIYTVTGYSALTLLYAATTISLVKKKIRLLRYRRMVGLFAFFYALLHFSNFVILDMELDPAVAFDETLKRPFIYLGVSAFAILLFMAVTSLPKLFARFYRYHRLIYVALLLVTVHFVMAQKALAYWQWEILAVMAVIGVLKVLQRTGLAKL
ncbi:ferric reductase-like transmembrane domain-containing protein [Sulfurimonas sp. HSL-3221]|uniref:ferric reductase-like transmembrane domain-containing protein n=1 Tax=Thiomicrolovo sulfuroxydans TaxID=2894755 RepID=UPI001E615500|nr:ferric reductase-like transmembrane domain-containing protein [Sulfurimonas sp. HSL-3221]UFS61576.1 ferric reductase-like transmembrane domain-containing protein [Sulfurimonas sp. HSL-3221]